MHSLDGVAGKHFSCTSDKETRCFKLGQNIIIYHEFVGRIDKYVPRVIVRHPDALSSDAKQ